MAGVVMYLFVLLSVLHCTAGSSQPAPPKLGDTCSENADCGPIFSECVKGKCACIQNFTKVGDDTCKPTVFNCPFEQPLKVKGEVKLCFVGAKKECEDGYFCFSHQYRKNIDRKSHAQPGHCCRVTPADAPEQQVCPLGNPDTVETCGFHSHEKGCGSSRRRSCMGHTEDGPTLCCPSACDNTGARDYTVLNVTCV